MTADSAGTFTTPAGGMRLGDIVEAFTVARENAGDSQRAVAERIGVAQSTLAMWETSTPGRRQTPGADRLFDWGYAVGVGLRTSGGAVAGEYEQGWNDCAAAIAAAAGGTFTPYGRSQGH